VSPVRREGRIGAGEPLDCARERRLAGDGADLVGLTIGDLPRQSRNCRTAESPSRAEVYPRDVEMNWRDATLGQAV